MKRIIIFSLLSLFLLSLYAQEKRIYFRVENVCSKPVKRSVLNKANGLNDIIEHFPFSWIDDFQWFEVSTNSGGKTNTIKGGSSAKLNDGQKNLLATASLHDEVSIKVSYRARNSITNRLENYQMHRTFEVAPETAASYVGGDVALKKYIQKNAIDKIQVFAPTNFPSAVVRFTVDPSGRVISAHMVESSGSLRVDHTILQAVAAMPAWKPARDINGKGVNQEFELIVDSPVGNGDGC